MGLENIRLQDGQLNNSEGSLIYSPSTLIPTRFILLPYYIIIIYTICKSKQQI